MLSRAVGSSEVALRTALQGSALCALGYLKPLQRNHAHLFAPVAFTLGCRELKPLQRDHAHLFALVAFAIVVLNCTFHSTFDLSTCQLIELVRF